MYLFYGCRTLCTQKSRLLMTMKRWSSSEYSDTLNLPRTAFPLSMKDQSVAPKKELEIQKKCKFDELYKWQWNDSSRTKLFVLHDGPPYANGDPHVGHALNKIMKDITNRYKLLQGYRVHYIPGWDCHGMPIEQKALAEARADHRSLGALEIRNKANAFAQKAAKKQLAAFSRWAVMADWKNGCYYTTDKPYEVRQLEAFYQMYEKGFVYQDYMPVQWSPSSGTALAEAEIEYKEDFTSPSVYVKYRLKRLSAALSNIVPPMAEVDALIWTTTPWTLPANQAICFGSSIQYCLVKDSSECHYVVASSFYEKMSQLFGKQFFVVGHFDGSALEGCTYSSPAWSDRELPLLPAIHVTVTKGTGLVHTAPAHGTEDFQVALKHGLPMECFVDEEGRYMEGVRKDLVGKNVLTDGNKIVLEVMSDQIVHRESYVHSYPHDWRTKQPLITRASRQWFVDTSQLKNRALKCLRQVSIVPNSSGTGMVSQLNQRTYWCISRQRVWGVPIPVFYESRSRKPIITRSTIDHLKSIVSVHGTDAWWKLRLEQLLPRHVLTESGVDDKAQYVRGDDVLDIWFDSGVSWSTVLRDSGQVADVYLEGVDQFGGWFQSSLLTSVAVQDKAPYRCLVVHGFVLDEEGKKMSKSLGNVVDPDEVINGGKDKKVHPAYGADVLRLWVAQSGTDPRVHIGPSLLAASHERLFRLRKSLRYLMSNLDDFNPALDQIKYENMRLIDRYTLHLLSNFVQQVTEAYEEFNYSRVVNIIDRFNSSCVSAFHAHVTKDRMYCSRTSDVARRSAQTVQFQLLDSMTRLLAPVLPHLTEEIFQYHPLKTCGESVFKQRWFEPSAEWTDPQLSADMEAIVTLHDALNGIVSIGKPGDYDVSITCTAPLLNVLQKFQSESTSSHSELCEVLQSASVTLVDNQVLIGPETTSVPSVDGDTTTLRGTCNVSVHGIGAVSDAKFCLTVRPTRSCQCPRCRRRLSDAVNRLCVRCDDVVSSRQK